MTGEEFAQQLLTWKKALIEDVIPHYRAGNRERGRLAFKRWKERFTRFLKEHIPSEASRFKQETQHFGFMVYPGKHPYDTFMREDGKTCIAFIDDLKEEAEKGRLADLQTKSPIKPIVAGENMSKFTNQTLLKVRNSISRRLSRPRYEDLLIELEIYPLFELRDEHGRFKGMTKDAFIEETLLDNENNYSILRALLERRILDSETKRALIEDGVDLQGMTATPDSDNVKEKTSVRKSSRRRLAGTKNKTVAATKKRKGKRRKKVILFLAANPTDASRLRLDEELREIQEKLRLAKLRSRFELEQRLSVRSQDISQSLLDVKPDIVHFSGHGTTTGELCLENRSGETHPVNPSALASLFRQFANQVSCVVLNACYSKRQATAIAKHVKYVIGVSESIGDKAAIAFAIGFYQALGAGCRIERAYRMGCAQAELLGVPEHLTPVLIKKQAKPVEQQPPKETSRKVSLQAWNGRYIYAVGGGGGEVLADRNVIDEWAIFDLIELEGNKIALRAHNDDYLSAERGGERPKITADRPERSRWEAFTLSKLEDDRVRLYTARGPYVSVEDNARGEVVARRGSSYEQTVFRLIQHSKTEKE